MMSHFECQADSKIPQSFPPGQLERSFISKMASCLHADSYGSNTKHGVFRWKIVENTNNASRNMVNHKHNVPHEGKWL